jgi:Zn-dependent protease with chaperone function
MTAPQTGERVSFFAEQRRHRRASGRLATVAILAVALMGIPVSLVLTPAFYGAVLIVADVYNLFHPIPPSITGPIGDAAHAVADANLSPVAFVLLAFIVTAPGIAFMVSLWLGVRGVLGGGVGALLLGLGAREPRPGDLEERQIQNLVEEMAIAAGLPPPQVRLIDSAAGNAAVVGTSDHDAIIVVSRGLLDDFSREDTQAIVGHLIGSISNGDLRIAYALSSALQTFGLLITFLDAPFGPVSGRHLRRLLRLTLRRRAEPAEADALGALLAGRLSLHDEDEIVTAEPKYPALWAPLAVANAAVKWTLFVFTTALVGPMLALLWRARRYLADATAVQLTRNPEALWSALANLIQKGGMPDGSGPASYLFIVGPETVGWTRPGKPVAAKVDDNMATNSLVSFHPEVGRRLRRLEAQGASSRAPQPHSDRTPLQKVLMAAGSAFVWGIFSVGMAAAAAGMVLVVGVSVFIDLLVLGIIHGAFSLFAR